MLVFVLLASGHYYYGGGAHLFCRIKAFIFDLRHFYVADGIADHLKNLARLQANYKQVRLTA